MYPSLHSGEVVQAGFSVALEVHWPSYKEAFGEVCSDVVSLHAVLYRVCVWSLVMEAIVPVENKGSLMLFQKARHRTRSTVQADGVAFGGVVVWRSSGNGVGGQ